MFFLGLLVGLLVIIAVAAFAICMYACIVLARSCDELEESMRNQIIREEVDSDVDCEETSRSEGKYE